MALPVRGMPAAVRRHAVRRSDIGAPPHEVYHRVSGPGARARQVRPAPGRRSADAAPGTQGHAGRPFVQPDRDALGRCSASASASRRWCDPAEGCRRAPGMRTKMSGGSPRVRAERADRTKDRSWLCRGRQKRHRAYGYRRVVREQGHLVSRQLPDERRQLSGPHFGAWSSPLSIQNRSWPPGKRNVRIRFRSEESATGHRPSAVTAAATTRRRRSTDASGIS